MRKRTWKSLPKMTQQLKSLKRKSSWQELQTKKGFRDLVMSTEGISLKIVENSVSGRLTRGDLKKAWGRLERCWNPKRRDYRVQFYMKFLHYKLENVKQRPLDWLAFMEKKRNDLANTGHIMDDEMLITHLLNLLKIPVLDSSRSPALLRGSSTLLGSPVIFS